MFGQRGLPGAVRAPECDVVVSRVRVIIGTGWWTTISGRAWQHLGMPGKERSGAVVFRSRTNQICGWLLGFGLLVGGVLVDPLHLHSMWSDVPRDQGWYVQLPYVLFFWVVAQSLFAVFARPRIEITDSRVVLRNVVRDVVIPAAAIESAESDGKYLVVTLGGRRYAAAGTESANVQAHGGVSAKAAALVREAMTIHHDVRPVDADVRVRWRRPEPAEWVLAAGWLAYVLASCVADLMGWQPA